MDKGTLIRTSGGNPGALTLSPLNRMRAALVLAILADVLQIFVFPIFVEGAASPADDILDLGMAGLLTALLGWHWEFLPSFLGKLVPGVDLVPLWSLAVANVYRKSRQAEASVAASATARNASVNPRNE